MYVAFIPCHVAGELDWLAKVDVCLITEIDLRNFNSIHEFARLNRLTSVNRRSFTNSASDSLS